tara:strand:+ start:545 stop:1291 length:747 start_codon:yes stop_codon:yes gene_type:complete
MAILPILAVGANIGMGIWGASRADRARREAEEKERESRQEMDRLKAVYANLDTSNPYLNMENTMEDLTINQKQAEFQRQQFQQSQANILESMRGAAGGSGIGALAQSLAQQGQIAAQQAAASIGKQEANNQRLAAQEAGRIQSMERKGEVMSRNMQRQQTATLLGMSQQETAAYMQQEQQAEQAKWDAISGTVSNLTSMVPGMGGTNRQGLDQFGNVSGPDQYSSSYQQPWMDPYSNQQGMPNVYIKS